MSATVDRLVCRESLTVQSDHGDNEANGQNHDHKRINLQSRRLVRVQPYHILLVAVQMSTSALHSKRPGLPKLSSGCNHVLNMVLLLPPAPAALVLAGRALAILSARSAAAFLLIAVAGPPGAFGEAGRAVVEPVDGGELIGDEGRGEDCDCHCQLLRSLLPI